MTRPRLYWLAAAIAICAAALTLVIFLGTDRRPSDYKLLQGTWVAGHDNRFTLTFADDMAVFEGFPEPRRMLFRLDAKASPKRITTCDADGPGIRPPIQLLGLSFGRSFVDSPVLEIRGIYQLEGDRLRIFMAPQGQDYPKSFDNEVGLLELHRP